MRYSVFSRLFQLGAPKIRGVNTQKEADLGNYLLTSS